MRIGFGVWIHYIAAKLGRGELFEVIECLSFLRMNVIGPFILMKHGSAPLGVRRIEMKAEEDLPLLIKTVPDYNAFSCASSLKATINLYRDLRKYHHKTGFIKQVEAEKEALLFLEDVIGKL
ncbi:MAG: hypothetical protein ACM3YE_00275 [Bacteroidota bacterium]